MNKRQEKGKSELLTHRVVTVLLYAIAFGISHYVLTLSYEEKNSTLLLVVSTGAILATFGSALSSIGGVWERDLHDRVLTNIDILYVDILKQKKWRRWPFLARTSTTKNLDGKKIEQNLENAKLPLNVGTHHIEVDLPTVLEDFFDLPVIKNTYKIIRFRIAASTTLLKGKDVRVDTATGLDASDEFMAYQCIYSAWVSVFKFRCFRYLVHFGSALTISGTVSTILYVLRINT